MKRNTKQTAEHLYISNLFRRAKKYAEANYDEWFILSAKNHLLEPNEKIKPYDESLSRMSSNQRMNWAKKVCDQISSKYPDPSCCKFFFHAGELYRRQLVEMLRNRGYTCEEPLKGLRIGEQIAWYLKSGQQSL